VRQLITRTGLEYLNHLSRSSAGDWALKRELAAAYLRIGMVQDGSSSSNLGDAPAALASFQSAGRLLDEVLRQSPADRQARLDRMTVFSEVANLQQQTGQFQAANTAAEAGLRISQSLLSANANDLAAAQAAGLFHLELARLRQESDNPDAAQSEGAAGVRLLRQVVDANPDNREAQLDLAESHARLGSLQLNLGRPQDALANFRSQAAVLDALCQRFPSDTAARHALMLAYSHLGDTLGNPEYANAGDLSGAFQAYRKVAEAAKLLYDADPADVRALSDYGIALLRLGLVTPAGPAKREAFEDSAELLSRAAARNPQSRMIASHKTWVESELAALFLSSGDRAAGMRYYQTAMTTAEKALAAAPKDTSSLKGLVVAVRGLAEEQARAGARAAALASLDHALTPAGTLDASAPPSALAFRVNIARSWQAAGSVYAILSTAERGPQSAQDRDAARTWYRRAVGEWHRLESQKGFQAPMQKEMAEAMQALGGLR